MTGCHAPQHRSPGGAAPAYLITYETPPLGGRHPGPGLTLSDLVCNPCRIPWAGLIEQEGGRVVELHALPARPAPAQPAPVGLDAIDPPAPQAEKFSPDWAVHPGEMLAEVLEERGLDRGAAADMLLWPAKWVDQVIDDRHDITDMMAYDLWRVFGIAKSVWLNMQSHYAAHAARATVAGG